MAASAAVSDDDLQAFGVMMGGAAVVVTAVLSLVIGSGACLSRARVRCRVA